VDSRFSCGSCLIESLKACPSIVHRVQQNGVVHAVNSGIGGFNQRQGEALPPQIFLTLKFVVWAKLQIDDVQLQSVYSQENYRSCCHLMSDFKAKRHQIRFRLGLPPDPAKGSRSAPQTPSWPHLALGPPGLETTCIPKYVSLNPPMNSGVTGGAPGDTLQGGDTRLKLFFCGWI